VKIYQNFDQRVKKVETTVAVMEGHDLYHEFTKYKETSGKDSESFNLKLQALENEDAKLERDIGDIEKN
jgi:hypothetical protein